MTRWSSSAKRVSRLAVAVVLLLSLASCAPDAGGQTQRVEVTGSLTAVTASDGSRSYVLDVRGQGLLPLDLTGLKPPLRVSGVVVEVPDSLQIPDAASERFAALDAFVNQTGEPLTVVDFLG